MENLVKVLNLINPTGDQVLNLSQVIPQIEEILQKNLHWYLISFFGNINSKKLGLNLSKLDGPKRQELTSEILKKFDYDTNCEFHEGFVAGFQKTHYFKKEYSVDELKEICDVLIGYDHLNTGAITAQEDFLIDKLTDILSHLDRYPSLTDSSGKIIKLPAQLAEGIERSFE